ncbi:MAG: GGDEF domain-containing protein [Bdellovibrionaceae bacterium]|nr:GGDEF domain-containing protein [Pseudobdellovibrionaceae bacterium]
MKKWMEKLIQQFDFEWDKEGNDPTKISKLGEDRATLLFLLDTYNKHLIEIEGHPVRKTREALDEFAKELISPKDKNSERVLFRLRQFFSAYRIDETTYFQKTFEDFRTIIWDFVDQLAEDVGQEQKDDFEIRQSLDELKEAVESNSIDDLKNRSRKFIDHYIEKQFKKDKRRSTRMKSIRKNLSKVKKQLGEASSAARTDHLTNAYNRKTFDEYCENFCKLLQASGQQVTVLLVDIDHFKRINDTYGHPVGDFVLKELVQSLKTVFNREADLVARIGGEEFAIILPDYNTDHAMKKAEELMAKLRAEAYVHEQHQIRFTVSIGIAQLANHEDVASWVKRADLALYHSKNTGRNRATVAPSPLTRVA